ncbi:MAG: hypothetical protein ETSY1_32165 [Candidatus Entotheonella factor]|uniref:Aspartyl/asparaginy/proline hydroxylase domain-containing protein n=2 Tax=Candidatus Entotheonella TaxID=93171 RepID=W4LAD3_ENTF1|nr:MAG: hypothetical protein ETSY1_32165 [Candidatus Entotheonella factor]
MRFVSYLKMPFHFDAARLQADLDRVDTEPWSWHGNRFIYRGEWSGLSFRNRSGDPADLAADSLRGSEFVKTPLLDRCDYISEVMGAFACPLGSVRFLKVAAGAEIDEHVDGGLCYEVGEARLHIPVVTHADLDFRLNGERLVMQPGECWYINANMPHSVANRGAVDRVHLVVDAGVNDWLRGYFEGATCAT